MKMLGPSLVAIHDVPTIHVYLVVDPERVIDPVGLQEEVIELVQQHLAESREAGIRLHTSGSPHDLFEPGPYDFVAYIDRWSDLRGMLVPRGSWRFDPPAEAVAPTASKKSPKARQRSLAKK